MPNVCLAFGLRLAVLISLLWIGSATAWGQFYDNTYGPFGQPPWELHVVEDFTSSFPRSPRIVSDGNATVSMGVLRQPLSSKARRLLEKAMKQGERGNHATAIEDLREALAKYPLDASYTHNVLGLEYVKMRQFSDAKKSFEEAARLMPDESCNHSNYGLSLALIGELDAAEKEERKALQLDRTNSKAKIILEALLMRKQTRSTGHRP